MPEARNDALGVTRTASWHRRGTHVDTDPYLILERKRAGRTLTAAEIHAVVRGAADGSWDDARLAAFLMAAAIHGLDPEETRELTVAMLASGERWDLGREIPGLGDKHSTGGVGDKISLVLAPLLASCGQPLVMLTGRGLAHTGGTADKLEVIPGLDLALDRPRCLRLLGELGMAIGVATAAVAPADRRFYTLRDATATVDSLPLITASILSKKLATGAAAVVFDVKCGDGAFLREREEAVRLASMLVATSENLGCRASAIVSDMSQPLGEWAGHAAELREALDTLAGEGPEDLIEVTFALALELARLTGRSLSRADLERALGSGRARERFLRWAAAQGGDTAWLAAPRLDLAPREHVVTAPSAGVLARVATRRLGRLLARAARRAGAIDPGVALKREARLGQRVEGGQPLARLYLRRPDPDLARELAGCFAVEDAGAPPPLLVARVGGAEA